MTVLELVQKEKPAVFYCYDVDTGHLNRCELSGWERYRSYYIFKDMQVKRWGQGFNYSIGCSGFIIYCHSPRP